MLHLKRKNALTQTQKAHKRIFTLSDALSSITVLFETHSNRKVASNTKPVTTKRDIQGSSLDLL